MFGNENYDASSRKKNCGGVPWSDLNHDVLYSVMMRLGVVEFLSFSGVCKSWRSLAFSNRKTFMASKPPMILWTFERTDCYLEDFEGKKFKTIIPQSVGRTCVGLSCGYLIFFGKETRDFWLVNPITRHQLHFPNFPSAVIETNFIRVILVFSPSISQWVFVMSCRFIKEIWFSIVGTGAWDSLSSTFYITDLHVFKGKIYTLNHNSTLSRRDVFEMRLFPVPTLVPKLTLSRSQFACLFSVFDFISSDENLYLMGYPFMNSYNVCKLDTDQLNCVPGEKTTQEYSFFESYMKFGTAVKSDVWAASSSLYHRVRFPESGEHGKGPMYMAQRWYFPHECLNIDHIDD